MIGQFKILCRVKKLREESLFHALQVKRNELAKAELNVAERTCAVRKNEETLPARINAVYNEIMNQIVDVNDIDETKAKIVSLQNDHQQLIDQLERAIQTKIRLEKEVEEARQAYQIALRNKDKFDMIKSDLEAELAFFFEQKEEAEIEDLFAKGQPVPS